MKRSLMVCALVMGIPIVPQGPSRVGANAVFDHEYRSFAQLVSERRTTMTRSRTP